MSALSEYYLGSSQDEIELELLEISHTSFSQTFRVQRNSTETISVLHEGGAGPFDYIYFPLEIRRLGSQNDLDQNIQVDLGDLGSVLHTEIDRVLADNLMLFKPTLKYRTYRSTDLTVPLFGPSVHEITSINFNKTGASLSAEAPKLNINRTGKLYEVRKFPMLLAFFKKS